MAGEVDGINGVDFNEKKGPHHHHKEDPTIHGVLHRMISTIFFPDPGSTAASSPLLHRIKSTVAENTPALKEASRNTGTKVLQWTRRGSPLRALLVISVGTIALLALTGLLVFMLFFAAATVNAVVISLLVSLAAAGGFLALFFACVTAVYIGALSVAVFVISTATIAAIAAALIVTGWIAFFWTLWLVTKKGAGVAKHSLTMTGSAISAYSSARHARRYHELDKVAAA
ncbi:hypothetical protein Tsubulata_010396 [Turnera subulata]|uniref:Uncharacterized protein n=1 Tax=Turnera subulata TaxID=218843 RepID=A0A9Q0G2D6_9ROSI|nr:hypothetical protein Tsubulata_010396 [Turnera subulata]